MNPKTLFFLVILPGAVASIAVWVNHVRSSWYWSLAGMIALGWGMVAFAVGIDQLTRSDFVNWILLCVLPITAAFFVARFRAVHDRKGVATSAAFLGYLLALVIGIYIGTLVGVLKE